MTGFDTTESHDPHETYDVGGIFPIGWTLAVNATDEPELVIKLDVIP